MVANYYTKERNTEILIALLKAHNIRYVIASPGTTNINFVASLQQDSYFKLYSAVDERSAAYMACGMAAETGEPVVLSCTGATASRNYVPGLTEAFYRKLPVLAVTSCQHIGRVGHMIPQVIDRSVQMKDLVKLSVQIDTVHDKDDEWACDVALNKALLELRHRGSGPVHINLVTTYSGDFSVKALPSARVIRRLNIGDDLPVLSPKRVAIFVGSHSPWSSVLTKLVNDFCEKYDAVVLCDQTSNYRGPYRIMPHILCGQSDYQTAVNHFETMIHIGQISGSYLSVFPKNVWRVSSDGEISDAFGKLQYVFEMKEEEFFKAYLELGKTNKPEKAFLQEWQQELEQINSDLQELPFSNIWIAQNTIKKFPINSVLHLGILNSLRSWNFFESPSSLQCFSNTGGFGIDGGLSSLIGASFVNSDKLYFGVIGDLAFFYDINVLGNRHIGSNVRIMLINNGKGTEFRNYNHKAAMFGEAADAYIAAAGHFGQKSRTLVRHFAEDLGFHYLSASNKKDFLKNADFFLSTEKMEKPIIFEIFTDSEEESKALEMIKTLRSSASGSVKQAARKILGSNNVNTLKRILKR